VVCALTSNLERAKAPGNVLLKKGEGDLPQDSVVNITQIVTLDKADLVERIGSLSDPRIVQIVEGITLLLVRAGCSNPPLASLHSSIFRKVSRETP